MNDAARVDLFRREQREAGGEIEACLCSEKAERTRARAVRLKASVILHVAKQFEILAHREGDTGMRLDDASTVRCVSEFARGCFADCAIRA
ncbi:hypothetical protein LBMAG57_21100 [Verrucomicrobiota bacterium]|nr:hypothetical protein LBMAG57_21100 [Verrucomicrobiota bacterium]